MALATRHATTSFDDEARTQHVQATLRRAVGVALLKAWRAMGRLVARTEGRASVDRATIDDALERLDALRAHLRAWRDADDSQRASVVRNERSASGVFPRAR